MMSKSKLVTFMSEHVFSPVLVEHAAFAEAALATVEAVLISAEAGRPLLGAGLQQSLMPVHGDLRLNRQ